MENYKKNEKKIKFSYFFNFAAVSFETTFQHSCGPDWDFATIKNRPPLSTNLYLSVLNFFFDFTS